MMTSDFKLLDTIINGDEAEIVKGLLEGAGIKVVVKKLGAGSILSVTMGISDSGTEIYVPDEDLEKARAVISKKG